MANASLHTSQPPLNAQSRRPTRGSAAPVNDRYTYEPLDVTRPTIRLVRVARLPLGPIRLEIKHVGLKENGHVCLSYTWGDPTPTHTIFMNGRPFQARENLHAFLRKARVLGIRDWIWIDAICIDQENHMEQPNQVRMMSKIYGCAKQVLIYPGPFSGCLVNALLGLKGMFRNQQEHEIFHTYNGYGSMTPKVIRSMQKYSPDYLDSLFCLGYWTRMWIIQEVRLAKEAQIVTSSGLVCWKCIFTLYYNRHLPNRFSREKPRKIVSKRRADLLKKARLRLHSQLSGDHMRENASGAISEDIIKALGRLPSLPAPKDPSSGTTSPPQLNIFDLLSEFKNSQHTVRHDAVYGLLGLVAVPPEFPIDYSRKATSLALDVIQHFTLSAGRASRLMQIVDWRWLHEKENDHDLVARISSYIPIIFNAVFKDRPWDISAMCYDCYQKRFDVKRKVVSSFGTWRADAQFVWLARELTGLEDPPRLQIAVYTPSGHRNAVSCVNCGADVYGDLGFSCLWYTRLSNEVLLVTMKYLTEPKDAASPVASLPNAWGGLPDDRVAFHRRESPGFRPRGRL